MVDCIVNFYLDGVAEGLFVYPNIVFACVDIPVVVAGFYANAGGVIDVVAGFVIANIAFECWAIPVVVTGFYPNAGGIYPLVPVFGLN